MTDILLMKFEKIKTSDLKIFPLKSCFNLSIFSILANLKCSRPQSNFLLIFFSLKGQSHEISEIYGRELSA